MSNLINETFQKHLNILHKRLKLNEWGDPENDTISAKLRHWLDQNSSGYNSTFEVDTILNDLDIEKGTPAFNELVDAFKESGFELKGNEFVKIVKKGSGISAEKVKNTANQYIKHFGKGSSSLQMSARDFVSMSQGGGDPDVRSNFPNWSDENFKQLLDILYTAGGLKRPVDETFQKHLNLLHKKLNESMSIEDLATVSDEALDNAYHYGRSTPGNTFGWQANLKSAEFAKRVIDSGVTDIEKISDAIHSGWNETAKKFVANPDQFSDTQKLRDNGKLDAKIEQRRKLSNVNYSSLPEEEKEKDRVVARALLNKLKNIEENVDLVNEGFKDILTAMAVAGAVLLSGKVGYDNIQLRKKWTDAYEQVKVSDPEKAERIKKLIAVHRFTSSKYFGRRQNAKEEIESIIDDFNKSTNK